MAPSRPLNSELPSITSDSTIDGPRKDESEQNGKKTMPPPPDGDMADIDDSLCTSCRHRRRHMAMSERTEWIYNFVGEILFAVSAIFFTWVSIEANDWKSIAASLFFFVACVVFVIPMWKNRPF